MKIGGPPAEKSRNHILAAKMLKSAIKTVHRHRNIILSRKAGGPGNHLSGGEKVIREAKKEMANHLIGRNIINQAKRRRHGEEINRQKNENQKK